MLYTAGRFWIELLRIDTANTIGPFRLNVWTAIIVFSFATLYFVRTRNARRESIEEPVPSDDAQP